MKSRRFRIIRNVFLVMFLLLPLLGSAPPVAPDNAELPDISRRINSFTFDLLEHSAKTTNAPANTVLSARLRQDDYSKNCAQMGLP